MVFNKKPDLHLIIGELPPGLNGKGGLLRMHWTARRKLIAHWNQLIMLSLRHDFNYTPFSKTRPCRMVVERHEKRQMDWDNMGASLKPVMDALVFHKVILDDSPDVVLSLTLFQERVNKGERQHLHLMFYLESLEEKENVE